MNYSKHLSDKFILWFARFSLFFIYSYFGILKVFNLSPATPLVSALKDIVLPFLSLESFLLIFGIIEVIIGIMFLIPRFIKITFLIFLGHMIATFLPLILLQQYTWTGFLIPNMEAQYIIKNLALIAVALVLVKSSDSKNL
jgi:uncharacterized membrane protein YphA (DoxX/SURF4 family)